MSVSPKEKKMLQGMWEKSEAASGADLPDGTYQFKVLSARFHMTDKNKPTFKTKIKVTGGDEEYVGTELEINDNLETGENMGWFKRKLRRLNISITDDFEDVIDGSVADEMEGKVFEGQVKTKNDFLNVYVNRLIGENGSAHEDKDEEQEKEEKGSDKEPSVSEGDQVEWGDGKSGEVVEILEDEGKARVKTEDGTIVRVRLNALSVSEGEKEKDEEEEAEEGETDTVDLPDPDDVDDMKAPEVRSILKGMGFDPADMKDPRGVLKAYAALAADPKAKIELSQVKPLADALEVKLKKDAPMKEQLRALAEAVEEHMG